MAMVSVPISPGMADSPSDLQQRIQALYERVLAESDTAVPEDSRLLELRLRVLSFSDPWTRLGEKERPRMRVRQVMSFTERSPRSDVVVIN